MGNVSPLTRPSAPAASSATAGTGPSGAVSFAPGRQKPVLPLIEFLVLLLNGFKSLCRMFVAAELIDLTRNDPDLLRDEEIHSLNEGSVVRPRPAQIHVVGLKGRKLDDRVDELTTRCRRHKLTHRLGSNHLI